MKKIQLEKNCIKNIYTIFYTKIKLPNRKTK